MMKRLIALLIAFLLCSCAGQEQPKQEQPSLQNTPQTEINPNPQEKTEETLSAPQPEQIPEEIQDAKEEISLFAELEGFWRLDGKSGTASMQIDADGTFICYDAEGDYSADGSMEQINTWTFALLQEGEYIAPIELVAENKFTMEGATFLRYQKPLNDTALTTALYREIYKQNERKFLTGITETAGWIIVDAFEKDGLTWIYAFTKFAEYDYKYEDFTIVREVEVPALFTFLKDGEDYETWKYVPLDESLTDEEKEAYLQPLAERGKSMTEPEDLLWALESMCDMEAQQYLIREGSEANIWRRWQRQE